MNDESGSTALADVAHGVAGPPRDRIFLHDHIVEMEIGAYPSEFGVTQTLRFNVDLDVLRNQTEYADEVESVVSYDLIFHAIRDLAAGPRMKLLETFAERLAAQLLSEPRVVRAAIRIEKMDRVSGSLGVEIERRSMRLG
ncbi:MAG: dihydroneopterin aldolase [Pseudomonadota bacterium]